MWNRAELKARGKAAFLRNYWTCVIVALILMLLVGSGGSSSSSGFRKQNQNRSSTTQQITVNDFSINEFVESRSLLLNIFTAVGTIVAALLAVAILLAGIFLLAPLEVGGCRFFLENAYEAAGLGKLLFPFQNGYYGKIVVTMFLRNLFIALWSLLLIVPGIVKAYEYRMVSYLLADCPDLTREEAFRISREMMYGQKMEAFLLDLSFLGWKLLSGITCGLAGVLYAEPYQNATNAELFLVLKENYFRARSPYTSGPY